MKNFFNYFDKEKFILIARLIGVFLAFIIVINLIGITYSKYESGANSKAKAKIAFFIEDTGIYSNSIALSGLYPSDTDFTYDFYVANYKDDLKANVNIEYTLSFNTTTNLPLEYSIVEKDTTESLISSTSYNVNNDGVYTKNMICDKKYTFKYDKKSYNEYTLIVHFPKSYNEFYEEYQSLIDYFEIIVDAKQVV